MPTRRQVTTPALRASWKTPPDCSGPDRRSAPQCDISGSRRASRGAGVGSAVRGSGTVPAEAALTVAETAGSGGMPTAGVCDALLGRRLLHHCHYRRNPRFRRRFRRRIQRGANPLFHLPGDLRYHAHHGHWPPAQWPYLSAADFGGIAPLPGQHLLGALFLEKRAGRRCPPAAIAVLTL